MKRDRRKIKRIVNNLLRRAGYGKYVIDCRYHPCRVTAVDFYKNDPYGCGIDVISLLNGASFCCSYLYCGIEPISQIVAEQMVEYHRTHTFDEYLVHFGFCTLEELDAFHAQDVVWNFDKGTAVST